MLCHDSDEARTAARMTGQQDVGDFSVLCELIRAAAGQDL
jgi:hypothetical protein